MNLTKFKFILNINYEIEKMKQDIKRLQSLRLQNNEESHPSSEALKKRFKNLI